ncbi:hypothetical protein [Rhodococcus koreensis]|uniref:hypothetical protein n=1 Tax=Rhodococcus koreensis TaxID=99653 RepID=UPI00366A9F4A
MNTGPLLSALASAQDVHEVNLAIKAAFADDEFAADEGEGALLHLPKPRTTKPTQPAAGLDGLKVSVANDATSGVETPQRATQTRLADALSCPPDAFLPPRGLSARRELSKERRSRWSPAIDS